MSNRSYTVLGDAIESVLPQLKEKLEEKYKGVNPTPKNAEDKEDEKNTEQ